MVGINNGCVFLVGVFLVLFEQKLKERKDRIELADRPFASFATLPRPSWLLGPFRSGFKSTDCPNLSVLKRSVPKTLAFAFGSRLRSKTQRSKTRVLVRRLPNGKPQDRLRFRDLRGKTLAFKNTHCDYFLRFRGFPRGHGLRSGPLRSKKTRRLAFAFLSPLRP